MPLNLGGGGLLTNPTDVLSSDYRSAGSHQVENLAFEIIETANTYEEIVVIASTKTYYITGIVLENFDDAIFNLATGAAASEVDFLKGSVLDGTVFLPFITPLKITGGTRIAGKHTQATDGSVSLIGWQE